MMAVIRETIWGDTVVTSGNCDIATITKKSNGNKIVRFKDGSYAEVYTDRFGTKHIRHSNGRHGVFQESISGNAYIRYDDGSLIELRTTNSGDIVIIEHNSNRAKPPKNPPKGPSGPVWIIDWLGCALFALPIIYLCYIGFTFLMGLFTISMFITLLAVTIIGVQDKKDPVFFIKSFSIIFTILFIGNTFLYPDNFDSFLESDSGVEEYELTYQQEKQQQREETKAQVEDVIAEVMDGADREYTLYSDTIILDDGWFTYMEDGTVTAQGTYEPATADDYIDDEDYSWFDNRGEYEQPGSCAITLLFSSEDGREQRMYLSKDIALANGYVESDTDNWTGFELSGDGIDTSRGESLIFLNDFSTYGSN